MTGAGAVQDVTAGQDNRQDARPRRWWPDGLLRSRLLLAVAAIVLALLVVTGELAVVPAVIAFAVIAGAAMLGSGRGEDDRNSSARQQRGTLRDNQNLIETVLDGLPDPVVALDDAGDVVAANAGARAIAPALRRGEPLSLALRKPDLIDAMRRAATSRLPRSVEYFERVPLDRWYQVFVQPIGLSGEPPRHVDLILMTFHDLTPVRRVEEMRADFVANASHELRTPLAALAGFIETLQGPARDDAAARGRFLAIMQSQATRMARLVDDLLSLSRIELNAHVQPKTRVDVQPIVRQVADSLQTLARDREVEVKVTGSAAPLMVQADRDELIRVFENLIENALKYAASGKRVDIDMSVGPREGGGREARIAVRDYGPGIAPEHLPRLTERFYRVDVAESRAQGGTGLGLALVKHILNRHGGRLTVDSVLGRGATFTVRLPLSTGERGADT